MKNDHEWKDIALKFAESLVDVLDGIQDHDIKDLTGFMDEDCIRISSCRKEAKELLNYINSTKEH